MPPGISSKQSTNFVHHHTWKILDPCIMAKKSNFITLKPVESSSLYLRRMEEKTKHGFNISDVNELEELMININSYDVRKTNENKPLAIIPHSLNLVGFHGDRTNTDVNIVPKLPARNLKPNTIVSDMYKNTQCVRCDYGFEPHEKIVNTNGELWHPQCFVCAQCFRAFPEGIFYEFEGRKYCEHDFQMLFAPCCGRCGEFIIGRVIKAMNANWHPKCFLCEMCDKELADQGFIRHQNKALCHDCNARAKAASLGKHVCHKCHSMIDDRPLRFRGEVYHPYHFNCSSCGIELNADAREVKSRPGFTANEMNELYCLRCHDKMGIPICGACRRPIEERVVTALGKHFHVEHFVCAKCEKPFLGNRHYEKKGLAYCETHYHQLFGNLCFVCNQVIGGDVFTALNKAWCVHHFACSVCDTKMSQKTKFYEFDLKPTCKKCFDKFPAELRKRLKKAYEANPKKSSAVN